MFAELATLGIEGLVPMRTLPGSWRYDERKRELVQRGGRGRYRIGEKIRVKVVKVDEMNQQIDLELIQN